MTTGSAEWRSDWAAEVVWNESPAPGRSGTDSLGLGRAVPVEDKVASADVTFRV